MVTNHHAPDPRSLHFPPSAQIVNGKKWRCMFAATVAVGRAYQTNAGELPENMCPPHGFDAVVGEVNQWPLVPRYYPSRGVDGVGHGWKQHRSNTPIAVPTFVLFEQARCGIYHSSGPAEHELRTNNFRLAPKRCRDAVCRRVLVEQGLHFGLVSLEFSKMFL